MVSQLSVDASASQKELCSFVATCDTKPTLEALVGAHQASELKLAGLQALPCIVC